MTTRKGSSAAPPPAQPTDAEKQAAAAAYDKVVAGAVLGDIRLVKYSFEVKPEYYEAKTKDEDSLKLSFDHNFSSIEYSAADGFLIGEIHWKVEAKLKRAMPLKVAAVYLIVYSNVPQVEVAHAREFMNRVGRIASYPYFRAFVAQTSWASEADLPTLPVITQFR